MEFKVYQKELELQSRGWIPTFHDVTWRNRANVRHSERNGMRGVSPHHVFRNDSRMLA